MYDNLIRAEFHCHTIWSKDSLLKPADLVAACRQKGIGRVVVTDHNQIGGALQARKLAPDLVVVGEEIMTTCGEILAAFVQEEIPRGLEPEEVIRRLKDQCAFISVSHPLDRVRSGAWKRADLDRIIDQVDAIEVYNSRCWFAEDNDIALEYAHQHRKAGTAGSDAHTGFEIGTAVLEIEPFSNPDDLRQMIKSARVIGRMSSKLVHFTSRWAAMMKDHSRS
jgi:predicted metal-dependent phosphoesterase TrpH